MDRVSSLDIHLQFCQVSLPNSIKTLSFGSRFNQSLVGVTLPSSLETLSFADCFNKSMDDVTFPSSLQALTFGCLARFLKFRLWICFGVSDLEINPLEHILYI